MPPVTICVLLYGDHAPLARRALESIHRWCPREKYRLAVGANAVGAGTRRYLKALQAEGVIDRLIDSSENLNKCPMMRQLFKEVDTEYIWWFDDDSYITGPEAFDAWLGAACRAPQNVAMWGEVAVCDHPLGFAPDQDDVLGFVRSATWYRGLPPPSWRTGGKGRFDFGGLDMGDGRWLFILGGCWLIRTAVVRALDWPDRRILKMGDDVFLGEALRQHGWELGDIGHPGVAINTESRRGDDGSVADPSRFFHLPATP